MTNVVVWYVQQTDEVWAVADTMVAGQVPLTEQAAKILPVTVQTWTINRDTRSWEKSTNISVGFAYSGSTLSALLTYTALNTFTQRIGNIGNHPSTLPPLEKIAGLCRFLAYKYSSSVASAYNAQSGFADYVIFGFCPSDQKYKAYKIVHRTSPNYEQIVEEVDIAGGDHALLGADTSGLQAKIKEIQALQIHSVRGVEPRVALGARISKGETKGVGGTLQCGVCKKNEFSIMSSAFHPQRGSGALHYLGFSLTQDIEPEIGEPIVMPGLL